MIKQEFMAMSLPYKTVAIDINTKMVHHLDHYLFDYLCSTKGHQDIHDFKLVIRNLSDLTKEIEHNGEKFVPIDELCIEFMNEWCSPFEDAIEGIEEWTKHSNFEKIEFLPFLIVKKLIEWHFDIANLIEKGEAIDVNSLEINPYK